MQFSIASIFVLLSCLATAAEFQNMFLLFFRVVFLLGIIYSFASSNKIHKESKDNFTGEERSFESNKRDILFGFRPMIECATRRSAWDFLGYGCWCGRGGRGTPVDGVDRCCKAHDICYDNLSSVCPHKIMNYIMPYSTRSCTSCEPASYYWFWGSCRHNLCICDARAARCFAQHSFNEDFKSYTKSKC